AEIAKLETLLGLTWTYEESVASAGAGEVSLATGDLEQLRALAHRGEPAGIKRLLEDLRVREPEARPLLDELLGLVGRFRLRELGERLHHLQPRP
ncbi:MAG: hypothetical protein ACOC3I_03535, partial [Verrucomicrobiota bacterium]